MKYPILYNKQPSEDSSKAKDLPLPSSKDIYINVTSILYKIIVLLGIFMLIAFALAFLLPFLRAAQTPNGPSDSLSTGILGQNFYD